MIFLTGVANEAISAEVTGAEVLTQVVEPVQESLSGIDVANPVGFVHVSERELDKDIHDDISEF